VVFQIFQSRKKRTGQGKSKNLQWIAQSLRLLPDPVVGVMDRPQSKPADFYRELGELFGVGLTPLNRYDGFKALQTKCKNHCLSTLGRLVLLINEAQEVSSSCLTELRLLQSATFDSESILYTILCGGECLPERFRTPELLPLGSRIRVRLQLAPANSGTTPGIHQLLPGAGRKPTPDDPGADSILDRTFS